MTIETQRPLNGLYRKIQFLEKIGPYPARGRGAIVTEATVGAFLRAGIQCIAVNKSGRDKEGNTFDLRATDQAVEAGFAHNAPVLVKYPSGRLKPGNFVGITESGIDALRVMFALLDEGSAGCA